MIRLAVADDLTACERSRAETATSPPSLSAGTSARIRVRDRATIWAATPSIVTSSTDVSRKTARSIVISPPGIADGGAIRSMIGALLIRTRAHGSDRGEHCRNRFGSRYYSFQIPRDPRRGPRIFLCGLITGNINNTRRVPPCFCRGHRESTFARGARLEKFGSPDRMLLS